ncbi:MAG: putative metal-binding motif-containing protein [Bacteroidota bacterium]
MRSSIVLILATFISLLSFAQNSCNEVDLQYINDNNELVTNVSASCGESCLFAADPEACFTECMQSQVELTDDCIGCFSEQVECATQNCFFACAFGSQEDCANCIVENCLVPFNECAGIVDLDNDTYTTLNDCDDSNELINPGATEIWYDGIDQNCDGLNDYDQDQDGDIAFGFGGTDCNDIDPNVQGGVNTYFEDADQDGFGNVLSSLTDCNQPTGYVVDNTDCDDTKDDVYPNAPGTGQGVDNNCNQSLDPDEINPCLGDFDNNTSVDASDLLVFLTGFGCTSDCVIDLDGDDTVGGADLLIFLSVFATVCD